MTEANDPAFSQRTFDGTLRLIEDLRDHITSGAGRDGGADAGVEPASRMRAARDIARLTNRSTAAMSILLLHRALEDGQGGDIPDIPARLEELMEAMMVPSPVDALDSVPLPPAVADLMARAEALFADVQRVGGMIRGRVLS